MITLSGFLKSHDDNFANFETDSLNSIQLDFSEVSEIDNVFSSLQ